MGDTLQERKIIGREVVLSHLIGAGANGSVYLAAPANPMSVSNQFPYPAQFVVKIMRKDLYPANHIESMLKEVNAIRSLEHPFIVSYIGAWVEARSGEHCGRVCLAMTYCDGGDIHGLICDYIQRDEFVPNDLVLKIMMQVFSALNYSHANRIIHRDIKPANLFLVLEPNIEKTIAKALVGDYGVARPLDETKDLVSTRVGTPCYCSPEIAMGLSYTAKTDIFSAGVTMYELMTKKRPFWTKNCTERQTFYAIVHDDPMPYLRRVTSGHYDSSLVRAVGACLSKQEKMRPSALELLTNFSSTLTLFVRVNKIPVSEDAPKASPKRCDGPSPVRRISPVRPAGSSPQRKATPGRISPLLQRPPPAAPAAREAAVAHRERKEPSLLRQRLVEVANGRGSDDDEVTLEALLQLINKNSNHRMENDRLMQILDADTEAFLLVQVLLITRRGNADALENSVFKLLMSLKPQVPLPEVVKWLSARSHCKG